MMTGGGWIAARTADRGEPRDHAAAASWAWHDTNWLNF